LNKDVGKLLQQLNLFLKFLFQNSMYLLCEWYYAYLLYPRMIWEWMENKTNSSKKLYSHKLHGFYVMNRSTVMVQELVKCHKIMMIYFTYPYFHVFTDLQSIHRGDQIICDTRAGVSNTRPTGRMWPAKGVSAAHDSFS